MAGPSLGMNLAGIVDWGTSYPFIDMFKMSRPWFTQTDTQWNTEQAGQLDLDANGWVEGFTRDGSPPTFRYVSTVLFTADDGPRPGTYILDWKGEGTLNVGLIPQENILSRDDNRIVLRLDGTGPMTIAISATDPQGTGNYIRDIRLYHSDHRELIEAGQIFAPEFLDRLDDFRVLRFMDWGGTNNSTVTGAADLTPFDAAQQTDPQGVSVAMMVELANQTRTDPWICIPHMADAAYIRAVATYVRDNLDPGLVARFEFSNEVWNWGFEQAQYARQRAEIRWGDDAPGDVPGGWMQWYGVKAAEMARIVASVFGSETGTRALNVFSTQAAWLGLEDYALNAPDHVAAGGRAPRDAPFHVYAIAPYFDGGLASDEMADEIAQWMTMGDAGFRAAIAHIRSGDVYGSLATIGDIIAYHAGVAERIGWQLEAYEGGQHIVQPGAIFGGANNQAVTDWMVALVLRPEFKALYQEYLEIWRDNGGGMMAHFSDFGAGGRYGSWGVWDSLYAPDTPRAAALIAFNRAVAAWWDDDRPADIFDNGIARVDHAGRDRMWGTALDDVLSGLGGNNTIGGREGDDLIFARGGTDSLMGGAGDDRLVAGAGADTLTGGLGRDTLQGGTGADRFVFNGVHGSRPGDGDRITDFTRGADRVDLSGIDADTTRAGNQRFDWIGRDGFSRDAGELRIYTDGDGIILRGDVNGDGQTDLSIRLLGLQYLGPADIIL